jgi:hypothetical protein
MVRHKHHIIPRHAGGSDDENNLIEVSLTQHTMWHFANWCLWGRLEDRLAYKGLGGQVQGEELSRKKRLLGQIAGGKTSTPAKAAAARRNAVKARKRQQELRVGFEFDSKEVQAERGRKGGAKGKGYIWITNGSKTTQIPSTKEIPDGWIRGRKLYHEP